MNRFRLRCLMHYEEATQVFGISVDPNSGVAAAMEVPERHLTSACNVCLGGFATAAWDGGLRLFSKGQGLALAELPSGGFVPVMVRFND